MFGTSRNRAVIAGVAGAMIVAVGSTAWPWLLPMTAARVAVFVGPTMSAHFPGSIISALRSAASRQVDAPAAAPQQPLALPAAPGPATEPPRFDVVRVEPRGDMVVAGQATPGSAVDLLVSGQVVARSQTDAGGHFVVLPPTLGPGDYMLTLRQSVAATKIESTQSVAVSIPRKDHGGAIVALAEPGQPSEILAAPQFAPAPQPEAGAKPGPPIAARVPAAGTASGTLAVRSIELENGHGFYASGVAAFGSKLHLYLNNSHLADVVANAENAWSVKVGQGMSAGHYVVRVDAMSHGRRVAARVEVPFDVPVAMAEDGPAARGSGSAARLDLPPLAGPRPSPLVSLTSVATADAVIDEIRTTAVRAGDNLWDISRVRLGQGRRYTRIYAANQAQIRDPRLIYPGQVFVLPLQND